MSEVATTPDKKSESLFSKSNGKLLKDPLLDNNPITVQILGVCSALAVTSKVDKAIVMAIAVTFVAALANVTISLLRKVIPAQIRLIAQIVIVAAMVTVVREFLHAFSFDMYQELSVYIGLIITNCIIMGRLEAFALANKPMSSLIDGIGNGLGYGAILIVVAFFRELFGSGKVMGFNVLKPVSEGGWYVPNGIMVMPISAMFVVAILIWIQRSYNKNLVDIS